MKHRYVLLMVSKGNVGEIIGHGGGDVTRRLGPLGQHHIVEQNCMHYNYRFFNCVFSHLFSVLSHIPEPCKVWDCYATKEKLTIKVPRPLRQTPVKRILVQ